MHWFIDFTGRRIRFTDERLKHVEFDHPEMSGQIGKIEETLASPEYVIKSRTDVGADLYYRYYSKTPVGEKYLCVIVKERDDDFFILTAYFTDTIKRGETLWAKG